MKMGVFWLVWGLVFGFVNGYYIMDDVNQGQTIWAASNWIGLACCMWLVIVHAVRLLRGKP